MDKVKIKSCIKKNDNLFIIELSDGRKGTSFDDLTTKVDQEIELEIKNAKEYQGVMQYYFNLPGEKKQGKYAQKDWTFEKNKTALSLAIDSINKIDTGNIDGKTTIEKLYNLADKYYEYLNKKR